MKQVLIHKGGAIVSDVPAPRIDAGEILVKVNTSCLSVGTEMSGVRSSATPIWKKVLADPQKIVTTIQTVKSLGVNRVWSLIEQKKGAAHPTGYSAAGIVVEVGANITDIFPGDRVACAGAQYAYHAEYIKVPRNLCTPIPNEVNWKEASCVTLGAIALQGLRRATPTLGETFVVIGLGILGQLTVQLLKANGCKVIGIDLDEKRITLAKSLGMDMGFTGSSAIDDVARLTDGFGADGVIITAATSSDAVVSSAFRMCRKKGRVVLVGDVGLNLNRADFYSKEIDFFISSSYGPGRYDNRYEEQGLDYPLPFVRWTENRNMSEFLQQVGRKTVKIEPLITSCFPVEEATQAYASLSNENEKPLMVLLTYDNNEFVPKFSVKLNEQPASTKGKIKVAVIGAGGFARSAHLPNLRSLSNRFSIHTIVTRSGHIAADIAKQFGAMNASTDYETVLADPEINAVIIATRHHLHGAMALDALRAGKHVLVEKPLALTESEIAQLDNYIRNTPQTPILFTGYNRRFSPYAVRMADILSKRTNPFIINYRMNAGYIPLDNWVHGIEGGGRNIGEACHIYDLFTFFANEEVINISAKSIIPQTGYYGKNDNFVATMNFKDGSVATLTYSAAGSKHYPKEIAEMYVDGKSVVMTDYKQLDIFGEGTKSFKNAIADKGLRQELIAFADAINQGEWKMPWWQQLQSARIALEVEAQITNA